MNLGKEIQFMGNRLKVLGAVLLSVAVTASGAQTTAQEGDTAKTVHHATQLKKTPSVQQQIKAMHIS
jgi:hypothetical protein